MKTYLIAVVFALSAAACQKKEKLTINYTVDEPNGEIAKVLKSQLEASLNCEVELVIGEGTRANFDSLEAGVSDLTIAENSVNYQSMRGINAITPLYPQVLHIFYQSDSVAHTIEELLYDKKVFMGQPESTTYQFLTTLFKMWELDTSRIEITDNVFDNQVFCGFGDIIKDEYLVGFQGYKLFSFDDIAKYGKGSLAEAISLKFPQMKPFIIPERTYGSLTTEPIVTVATDAVLVARGDLDDDIVYEITKTIFHHKEQFTAISPLIYLDLSENFDRTRVNFPIHEGARIYYDRDEPSFFERYAEAIGVGFSILVTLISAGFYLSKWQKQRKKDRVDVFYKDIIDIKNELPKVNSQKRIAQMIKQLKHSQHKAFTMLINEELRADESFRIYMELSKEAIMEAKLRYKKLRSQQFVKTSNSIASREMLTG